MQVLGMISDADHNNSGVLNYNQFREIVLTKRLNERDTSDADLLDAYVAMGGDEDGSGRVDADMLIRTIKE